MAGITEDEAQALKLVTKALLKIYATVLNNGMEPGRDRMEMIADLAHAAQSIPGCVARGAPVAEINESAARLKHILDRLQPAWMQRGFSA